jgi:acylphosphatase
MRVPTGFAAAPALYWKFWRYQTVTEATGLQRREVCYQGRVQGVGFRYTAQWIAARFRVTGYVRNLPDGNVLLVAEGHPEELDRFLAEVRGQMGRYIDQARQTVGAATGQFSHFEIRF